MKIAVCDDEAQILGDMAKEIQNLLPNGIVAAFTDGKLLMESLGAEEWDLLLLDIDMPGISGLEIAGRLEEEKCFRETLLVFVTNHDELVYKVKLAEMLYFESDGNYLKLVTYEREYRFRETVGAVENVLADQGFIRLHRGFLVNQEAVRVLGPEEAELVSGKKLPIGRSYGEAARRQLLEYMRK